MSHESQIRDLEIALQMATAKGHEFMAKEIQKKIDILRSTTSNNMSNKRQRTYPEPPKVYNPKNVNKWRDENPERYRKWLVLAKNKLHRLDNYGYSIDEAYRQATSYDPQQRSFGQRRLANRYTDGWIGRGSYRRARFTGRGGFFKKASRGFKTANKYRKAVGHTAKVLDKSRVFDSAAKLALMSTPYTGPTGAYAAGGLMAAGEVNSVIAGRGAYYNTLFPGRGPRTVGIESVRSEHGNMVISRTEKVCDVFGCPEGQPFTTIQIPLQPGNFMAFPKLAQNAQNWKEYEFIQCIFEFQSTVPDTYTTESLQTGKILMATQLEIDKPVWTTLDEFESQENKTCVPLRASGGKIGYHGVECDPRKMTTKGLKHIRTDGEIGKDLRSFDHGRFEFMVYGSEAPMANKIVGELRVTYKVKLKNHRDYSMFGYGIPNSEYVIRELASDPTSLMSYSDYKFDWDIKNWTANVHNSIPFVIKEYGSTSILGNKSMTMTMFESDSTTENDDGIWYGKGKYNISDSENPLALSSRDGDTYISTTENISNIHMQPLVFEFPSNLKGDYELIITNVIKLAGNKIFLDSASTPVQTSAFAFPDVNVKDLPEMRTYGMAIGNSDIYKVETVEDATTSAITTNNIGSSTEHSLTVLGEDLSETIPFRFIEHKVKVHFHLSQMINSVGPNEVLVPTIWYPQLNPYIQTTGTTPFTTSYSNVSVSRVSRKIEFNQYNSNQSFGDVGTTYYNPDTQSSTKLNTRRSAHNDQ